MKKILIIEDDRTLMGNTADFLREESFEVFTVADGRSGLETALKELPDLILCDISMPVMDGYQVYNELQKNPMASFIPFIFITAKSDNSEVRLGMGMGVDDYIIKPYTFEELLIAVNVRIEKQQKFIKAKEKAEIAKRAKSEFLNNISHEIRTPLNAIVGISELMMEDEKDFEKRKNIETILSSANELLVKFNDVLDISTIESGIFELKYSVFSLRNAVDSALKVLWQKAGGKRIGIIIVH